MAEKPFPFKVCEQCCSGGGGTGGDFTETDPTVPDWAKQPNPPTAGEIGAYTKAEVDELVNKQTEVNGSSNGTVDVELGKNVIETYDIDAGGTLDIQVEDGDFNHVLERTIYVGDNAIPLPISGVITYKSGAQMSTLWGEKLFILESSDLSGISSYTFEFPYGETGVKFTRYNSNYDALCVSAEVKEGSIRLGHINSEAIDEIKGLVLDESVEHKGVSTPTVSVGVGNTKTTTYDLTGVMAVTIPIDVEDTEITLKSSVGLMTVFVYYEGGQSQLHPGVNETTIDLTQYTGVYELYVVPTGSSIAEGTLMAEIPCSDGSIYANVREGSIGEQQLSTRLKANLVKNTDYATGVKAGVIKASASDGIGISNGSLYVATCGTSEIDLKKSSVRPLVPSNIDYAISKGTHQTMADDYDTTTMKVGSNMEGFQSRLPASYTAVKEYVDSSISNLIAKLKAAGVNID